MFYFLNLFNVVLGVTTVKRNNSVDKIVSETQKVFVLGKVITLTFIQQRLTEIK